MTNEQVEFFRGGIRQVRDDLLMLHHSVVLGSSSDLPRKLATISRFMGDLGTRFEEVAKEVEPPAPKDNDEDPLRDLIALSDAAPAKRPNKFPIPESDPDYALLRDALARVITFAEFLGDARFGEPPEDAEQAHFMVVRTASKSKDDWKLWMIARSTQKGPHNRYYIQGVTFGQIKRLVVAVLDRKGPVTRTEVGHVIGHDQLGLPAYCGLVTCRWFFHEGIVPATDTAGAFTWPVDTLSSAMSGFHDLPVVSEEVIKRAHRLHNLIKQVHEWAGLREKK